MHKIIRISLSAALLSARLSGSAEAAYQPEDFEQIETLIEDGNWVALRSYISANPRVLECDDELARELRRFLQDASGLYAALTFENSMFPDIGLRAFIPDDCIVVADVPASSVAAGTGADDGDDAATSAPVTSRAASPRDGANPASRAPLGRSAVAAPSIY